MNYQDVAGKVTDFLTFKAQLQKMKQELDHLEHNPPQIVSEVLTWDEAVAFAESQKAHHETLQKLRMGIANRIEIIQSREKEVGELLPIQNHYIIFKLTLEGKEESFKIGYFPDSYGFRIEKIDNEKEE
jgi:ribonuclease D